MKKQKIHLIKVTTSSIYAFEEGSINGWSVEQVIKDWFEGYPMDMHHATRDTYKIGNTTLVEKVEILDDLAFDNHVEECNRKRGEKNEEHRPDLLKR